MTKTTTKTTTEKALMAACLANPSDMLNLLAMADHLEEQGRAAEADAYRWMVAKGRQVGDYTNKSRFKEPHTHWWHCINYNHDYRYLVEENWIRKEAFLPAALVQHVRDAIDNRKIIRKGYRNDKAAVLALVRGWCRMTEAERAECWAWTPPE